MKRNLKRLFEYYGIDPTNVPDYTEFWALYAYYYDEYFEDVSDERELEEIYNLVIKKLPDNKARLALTFFYNIRRDELDDPNYWNKVGMDNVNDTIEKKDMVMEAKIVSDVLNEYNEFEGESEELKAAKEEAIIITKEDPGIIQHVNKIGSDSYRVEDWFDSNQTVASYVNGILQ